MKENSKHVLLLLHSITYAWNPESVQYLFNLEALSLCDYEFKTLFNIRCRAMHSLTIEEKLNIYLFD